MRRKQLLRRIYWLTGFLVFFVLAFLISVIFLNPSSVGNRNFLWNFNLWAFVWALIFIAVLILTFVLARTLIHLFFELHAGQPGSKIRSKLVLTFIIFSLFPALIMSFMAFGLINQNLTNWMSAPSEQLLDSSSEIAARYYELQEKAAIATAVNLVGKVGLDDFEAFRKAAAEVGFSDVVLTDAEGRLLSSADSAIPRDYGDRIQRVLEQGAIVDLEKRVNTETGIVDRGVVGLRLNEGGILFLEMEEQESIAFHTARVQEANEVYKGLRGTLASLRNHYLLILGLTTLAVVFAFVWLGNYIARRLTVPLEALAEGSRALASGNLDHRVDVDAVDELGILVASFNQMAAQLKQSRSELEKANQELQKSNIQLDERRRYIEAVLQNIATGVLTVDESEVIRTVNQAALKMLQTTPREILSRHMKVVTDQELYLEFRELKKKARLFGTARKQVTIRRNESQLYVAATITTSPGPSGEHFDYLIVLDDLTELIRAEKFAAWQEVARRLAHEIKNPLTPIQLSAERISRRFDRVAETLPESVELRDFRQLVGEASRMIVSESRRLKNLLSEFSRFARLPICKPQDADLHALIDKTLSLYDGHLNSVEVVRDFDPLVQLIWIDPEQMQRVFVNLLENSLDALVEVPGERQIRIRTSHNQDRASVTIAVEDTGHGIPVDDYDHLFLPYFSRKKKGTGLGLAIVRQIVSEHDGFIRAEPNLPRGTRIVMEIPLLNRGRREV
ncbi:MAG: HAMP domain-containing protein [Acidobacteriota bacterium]|nr:MAG: HAMP domain-containing protein [Acidobacteriota bacterium]